MIRGARVREAKRRYRQMAPVLNEQGRRRFVALEACALGHGGVSAMARISGLARSTIYHGLSDIHNNTYAPPGRVDAHLLEVFAERLPPMVRSVRFDVMFGINRTRFVPNNTSARR